MTYLVLAALLIAVLVFAALSKRAEMSVVTMPIVFTGLGWLTWLAGAELIGGEEGREVLHLIAELTLILLLFADATRVRIGELLYSGCVIGVHTDAQKLADATRSGGIKQGIKGSVVGGQVQTIKVAVRVNQHNNYMVWVGRSDCRAPAR